MRPFVIIGVTMSYTVKCFYNTGFDAVNIPDSPALLNEFQTKEFPAVDILQPAGLSSVAISASWGDVQGVDYCQIGSEYYSVGVPRMTSADVAVLPLVSDQLTTNGGPKQLSYLDGVTERHTTAEDNLFEYTQDDEYMAPQQALLLDVAGMLFAGGSSSHTAVESTIDLVKLGAQFDSEGNFNGRGITFADTTEAYSGESVTVPYVEGVGARTNYQIGGEASNSVLSPNTRLYEASESYPLVMNALAAVRSLGVESALISQVAYPDTFVQCVIGNDGQYSSTVGKEQSQSCGLAFEYNTTVKNKKVFSGQYNKYGLLTASGANGEYLPEQINDGNDSPNVKSIADPRPDGKPYFRFENYEGNTDVSGFFISCVSGMQWQNVPLTYTSPSGSYMNEVNFQNDARIAGSAHVFSQRQAAIDTAQNAISGYINAAGNVAGAIGSGLTGDFGKAAAGVFSGASGIVNTTVDTQQAIATIANNQTQYEMARNKELQNYQISQTVVAPTVLFPFNANIIRDFIGNGVIVYRYKYSTEDTTRIDKLLTMFGYKDTAPLTSTMFNARTYFDYVRAYGVSIGGNIAMWRRKIIVEQLNAGVRVWHVKPNVSYYNNNPAVRG